MFIKNWFSNKSSEDKLKEVKIPRRFIFFIITFGVLFIICYHLGMSYLKGIGASFLIAGASFVIGGLFGFLFGIPRTLQREEGIANGTDKLPELSYMVNSNLEQISDWLTKIIVGVGLTQMYKLPEYLKELASILAPILDGKESSGIYSITIIIYFVISGFMLTYLWTRIELTRLLIKADKVTLDEARVLLEEKIRIEKLNNEVKQPR